MFEGNMHLINFYCMSQLIHIEHFDAAVFNKKSFASFSKI